MGKGLRVLALEPYFGGSHKAFLQGWIGLSRHSWTLLNLPPRKWKWRMRHSAITLADLTVEKVKKGEEWDLLLCSDMLNLAEYLGLVHPAVKRLPSIVYFHENQLTYPVIHQREFDYHFVLTNMITALAGSEVWFNSSYHRDVFLSELRSFLKRMPDFHSLAAIETIRLKSSIKYPGIHKFPERRKRPPGPMRIVWAARWEYDKNPELFFEALRILKRRKIKFRLSIMGKHGRNIPDTFSSAKDEFSCLIDRWGYQQDRFDYETALLESDVFVSTAEHEFFGISVIEAAAAGAFPLVPERLAYPETLELKAGNEDFYYKGGANRLAERLIQLSEKIQDNNLWGRDPNRAVRIAEKFYWESKAKQFDFNLDTIVYGMEEVR
jgi:glycosyltransferase involved in cell wall biosynthesis